MVQTNITRSKAQALILAGSVEAKAGEKWVKVFKAGESFSDGILFKISDATLSDVGRGAQKLRGAWEEWPEVKAFVQGENKFGYWF